MIEAPPANFRDGFHHSTIWNFDRTFLGDDDLPLNFQKGVEDIRKNARRRRATEGTALGEPPGASIASASASVVVLNVVLVAAALVVVRVADNFVDAAHSLNETHSWRNCRCRPCC